MILGLNCFAIRMAVNNIPFKCLGFLGLEPKNKNLKLIVVDQESVIIDAS